MHREPHLAHPGALECHCRVTALALASELTQVLVVLRMAGIAFHRKLDVVSRLLVAAGAVHLGVRAGQCEVRLLGVVKFPNTPAVRRVAVCAFFAEPALVNVVGSMTAVTLLCCAFVAGTDVALHTGYVDVQAHQSE